MGLAHATISNLDALWNDIENLWLFMTGHYHWLTHTYANHKHLSLWRHLSALLTNLDWLLNNQPAGPCGALCGI